MVRRDTNANSALALQWKGHTKRPGFFFRAIPAQAEAEEDLELDPEDAAADEAPSDSKAFWLLPPRAVLRMVVAADFDAAGRRDFVDVGASICAKVR